jgi:selenophosphate synthase
LQVAVNAYQWLTTNQAKWATIETATTPDAVHAAYAAAEASMARLNRAAAALMREHGARACTDVTGTVRPPGVLLLGHRH